VASRGDEGRETAVGQLDVTGWGFLAVLAAVAGLLWWRAAQYRPGGRVRGRHRRLNLVAAAILTILLAGDGVNSYFSYLPRVADVASVVTGTDSWTPLQRQDLRRADYAAVLHEAPHGGVLRLLVPDRGSGFGRSAALAYLPPQYFTEPLRRFPVVYLLHGSPGMPADWLRAGGAEQTGAHLAATGHPTLIVMPAMSHHWLDDSECVDSLRLKAETHLLRDVLPAVDGTFRTLQTPSGRVVAGMSAGGYCALNLGLRHPGLFGAIVDLSGLDRPTHSGGAAALFGKGPTGLAAAAANSPGQYAASLPPGLAVRIWLDSGRADGEVLSGLIHLRGVLAARAIPVRLTVRSGAHTYRVWRPALRQALDWVLGAQMSTETGRLRTKAKLPPTHSGAQLDVGAAVEPLTAGR